LQECWSNANYMCAQGGMSLVAFETGDEDNMIKRHLINIPGTCIIELLN
jgi:hypothetical protein